MSKSKSKSAGSGGSGATAMMDVIGAPRPQVSDTPTANPAFVTPGQKLGDSKSYASGTGTYELDGFIYASLCGIKHIGSAATAAPTPNTATAAAASQKVADPPYTQRCV